MPGDSYQYCCTSMGWKGAALALKLWPDARATFADDAFVEYAERWVNVGAWAQPDPCAAARFGAILIALISAQASEAAHPSPSQVRAAVGHVL